MRDLGRKLSNLLLIAVLLLLTYKLHICNILHESFPMCCDKHVIPYGRDMPIIIIGGVYLSGADLLRAMLDAHSEVRCDEEVAANNILFTTLQKFTRVKKEKLRLDLAGVTQNVLDAAIAAFWLETLALEGEPARRLCTNSPFMLTSADQVSQIFPQAKFIFMVRDGRAVVNSIIAKERWVLNGAQAGRGVVLSPLNEHGPIRVSNFKLKSLRNVAVTILTGSITRSSAIKFDVYNSSDPRASLIKWNEFVSTMYNQCKMVGNRRCMLVHYEQLVLHPESSMKQILSFLDVPWDESILNYRNNYRRGFVLKDYIASDPIEGYIRIDTLTKWVDKFPSDVVLDMDTIAPMLVTLGYDPKANPPNYGSLDTFLLHSKQTYNKSSGSEILLFSET